MSIFSRTPAAPTVEAEPMSSALEDISGRYTLDPTHTRIGFVARHAMVTKVRGSFEDFEGTAVIDAANPSASSTSVTIRTASVTTSQAQRDEHLRTSDFFAVEQHPTISFTSTDVTRGEDGEWLVTGDLTIKDTTRPVTVPFELTGSARDPFGNLRVGFEGSVVVNRKDWGLDWNAALETGGVLVSEKVTLEFDVSAIRDA